MFQYYSITYNGIQNIQNLIGRFIVGNIYANDGSAPIQTLYSDRLPEVYDFVFKLRHGKVFALISAFRILEFASLELLARRDHVALARTLLIYLPAGCAGPPHTVYSVCGPRDIIRVDA